MARAPPSSSLRQDVPSLIRVETFVAGERAMLERMLDVQRDELARLLSEVDDTAARTRLVPSLTTPLGLVKHATFVERVWFHSRVAGVPRADLGLPDTIDESFVLEPEDTVDSVRGAFLAACEHSREVAAAHRLDEQFPWHQGPVSLRFIYGHMIAELARHAGFADVTLPAVPKVVSRVPSSLYRASPNRSMPSDPPRSRVNPKTGA